MSPYFFSLVGAFGVICSLPLAAQDAPFAKGTLAPVNLDVGGASTTLALSDSFALENVNGPLVAFYMNVGVVFVELYPDVAPLTVANFLQYANNLQYDATFYHRSVPNFVLQGGGYYYGADGNYQPIPRNDPVPNEFALSNVHGTIAMAKIDGDLNSATSEWYFNNRDNLGLDAPDQRFTVFGRLIGGGAAYVDLINGLSTLNLNPTETPDDGPFSEVPIVATQDGGNALVTVDGIRQVPLLRLPDSSPGYLSISATTTDGGIVTPEITAGGLKLTSGSRVGSATITVYASDPIGQYASITFQATSVAPGLPVVSISAVDPTATETGNRGVIRLTRTGSKRKALIVRLANVGSTARLGADFPALPRTIIPAGKSHLDLVVKPKNDVIKEGAETFSLTLLDNPNYTVAPERSATVTILDNDVPTVTASIVTRVTTEKGGDVATVLFTRTGPVKTGLTIPFQLTGTAKVGADFAGSSSPVVIPPGASSAAVSFYALADTVKESEETIIVTPEVSRGYNYSSGGVVLSVIDSR